MTTKEYVKSTQFLKDVEDELSNLILHALKEEIKWFDEFKIQPGNQLLCVYGILSDECFSDRAHELIDLCANIKIGIRALEKSGWDLQIDSNVFESNFNLLVGNHWPRCFTPLELFVCISQENVDYVQKRFIEAITNK